MSKIELVVRLNGEEKVVARHHVFEESMRDLESIFGMNPLSEASNTCESELHFQLFFGNDRGKMAKPELSEQNFDALQEFYSKSVREPKLRKALVDLLSPYFDPKWRSQ